MTNLAMYNMKHWKPHNLGGKIGGEFLHKLVMLLLRCCNSLVYKSTNRRGL